MNDDGTPDVYDICFQTARAYARGFNPHIEYMPFTERFERCLLAWARRGRGGGQ